MKISSGVKIILLIATVASCRERVVSVENTQNEKKDVIVEVRDFNGNLKYVYNETTDSVKSQVKEIIYFDSIGSIDYDNSNFVSINNGDLFYHSPFNSKGYEIGKNRFITLYGNNDINENFSNLATLDLKKVSFNKELTIKNFKSKIPARFYIEEKIILDSIIKEKQGNKRIVKTYVVLIDTTDLLISNFKIIKQ
jgi:hypothetical protein